MVTKEQAISYTSMAIATLMQVYSLIKDDEDYDEIDKYTGQIIGEECRDTADKLQEALLYFTMNKAEKSKSTTIINYFNCKPEDYPTPTIKGDVKVYTFNDDN